ncbi:Apoptogenic protein 1, mitochondrial [Tieghemiomyces parasiticus]|uniref:Apoptogenic protein 1, mitochondrial n=1 Tax=Tieghemiomyces parasiticus TaxID=78921 RepID=A0A9W8A6J1_9FUNG|nr:Apoptogenic protein 1, mitochondrial [Tieghemiomyces parasiticus]
MSSMKFYRPADETTAERAYRELREAAQVFHHEFWGAENARFERERLCFINDAALRMLTVPEQAVSPTVDLAPFYRDYLNASYQRHLDYNRTWWRMNLRILTLGARAFLDRRRPGRRGSQRSKSV